MRFPQWESTWATMQEGSEFNPQHCKKPTNHNKELELGSFRHGAWSSVGRMTAQHPKSLGLIAALYQLRVMVKLTVLALKKLRQDNGEFKISLGSRERQSEVMCTLIPALKGRGRWI